MAPKRQKAMRKPESPATGLADEIVGKAKRAIGELTARPDIVLEGEAQEAKSHGKEAKNRRARRQR